MRALEGVGVAVVRGRRQGDGQAQAVVRVVAVDDAGQVHFAILPGSEVKNRHLLDRAAVA